MDADKLKMLRGEVYSKLAFAFKVIDVTVRLDKPKLKQPGWHRKILRDKKAMDLADEVRMPPPQFTGEEIARADKILDCFGKLVTSPADSKALAHYSRKRGNYGAKQKFCDKNGITRKVYYQRRNRAAHKLILSKKFMNL